MASIFATQETAKDYTHIVYACAMSVCIVTVGTPGTFTVRYTGSLTVATPGVYVFAGRGCEGGGGDYMSISSIDSGMDKFKQILIAEIRSVMDFNSFKQNWFYSGTNCPVPIPPLLLRTMVVLLQPPSRHTTIPTSSVCTRVTMRYLSRRTRPGKQLQWLRFRNRRQGACQG